MRVITVVYVSAAITFTSIVFASETPRLNHVGRNKNPEFLEAPSILPLPFEQAVMSRCRARNDYLYGQVMIQRPEFRDIYWQSEDSVELARQLLQFRRPKPDMVYHKALSAVFKITMQNLGMPDQRVAEILDLLGTMGSNLRDRKTKPQHYTKEAFEEKLRQQRIKNLEVIKKRNAARKTGLQLPLLSYIQNSNVATATPEELYAEALLYRDKHPSSAAFLGSLKAMWKVLKIHKNHVFRLNNDDQNKNFPSWPKENPRKGKTRSSTPCNNKQTESSDQANQDQYREKVFDEIFDDLQLEPLTPAPDYASYDYPMNFETDDFTAPMTFEDDNSSNSHHEPIFGTDFIDLSNDSYKF